MNEALNGLEAVLPVLARLGRILERTPTALPLPQYRLLAMVARGESRASSLAARLPVAKPTVTATVDALEVAGLLRRERHEVDGRVTRLSVTSSGLDALRATNDALAERLRPYFSAVSDPVALIKLLGELGDALETRKPPARDGRAE
jgi:DNA-binding MarR family transcriptional regulator